MAYNYESAMSSFKRGRSSTGPPDSALLSSLRAQLEEQRNPTKEKKKEKRKKDTGGFLGLGIGNVMRLPGQVVTGFYNLGKGIITDPEKTIPMAAKAIGQSLLSTVDTLTLGVIDSQLDEIAGRNVEPLWNRERGILPALIEDIGNVAIVAGAAGLAASAGGKVSAATAGAKWAAGDKVGHAAAVAQGAKSADFVTKAKYFSRPYQTVYHKIIRPATKAASEKKLAAAGVAAKASGGVRSYFQKSGRAFGAEPPKGVNRNLPDLDDASRKAIADEYNRPGFVDDADPAVVKSSYDAAANETQAMYDHMTTSIDDGGLGVGVKYVDDAEPYATPQAMFDDIAETGSMRVAKSTESTNPNWTAAQNDQFRAVHDYFGHADNTNPFGRGGEEIAYQAHSQMYSPAARRAIATETRGQNAALIQGKIDARAAEARIIEEVGDVVDDADLAGIEGVFPEQKAGLLPDEMVDPKFGHPLDEAHQVAAKGLEQTAKPRGRIERLLYGERTINESELSLPQRLLAGTEERIQAYALRPFIRQQERLAEATARATLRSPEVKAAIAAATDHVLPFVDDADLASRIVGDEIKSRLTGIRGWQKRHGLTDEVMTELGHRQEVIPKLLKENPEFAAAIDTATELWKEQRIKAFESMQDSRLRGRGLPDSIDGEAVVLTKNEMKKLRSAERDLDRAQRLEGAHQRQLMRDEQKGLGKSDEIATVTERLEAVRRGRDANVAEFDAARSGMPEIWGNTPKAKAAWVEALTEMVRRLQPDQRFRGFTYSPHKKIFIEAAQKEGRYVVGIVPGVEPLRFESLTPEMIDQIARQFQEAFPGNPDVMLGGWIDDAGMMHIEPSQLVQTRSDAMVLGSARGQESVWDLLDEVEINTEIGRPDIQGRFAGRRVNRNRVAESHYKMVRDKKTNVRFGEREVDELMALTDAQAVQYARIHGGSPDAYYAKYKVEFRHRQPTSLPIEGELAQTVLGIEPTMAIYHEMVAAGYDVDKMMKWYYRSHAAIEKRWRGTMVTLLNGHEVDAADLMYDLIAVTSVSADPATNLGNALTGIGNMLDFQKASAGRVKGLETMLIDYMKTADGKSKVTTRLYERLTGETHMYGDPKRNVMDILEGETITPYEGWDGWTVDYLRSKAKKYGGEYKALSEVHIGAEDLNYFEELLRPGWKGTEAELKTAAHFRAVSEYHGGQALNKIRSFRDNLANPETSNAVTIDSWIGRGVSPEMGLTHDLAGNLKGAHRRVSDRIRELAGELGDHLGRNVQPHEVQALVWGFYKDQISKQNVGVVMAHGADALADMRAGRWTPEHDPMVDYFDLDADMARQRLADLELPRSQRPKRLPKKEQVDVIRDAREVQEAETLGEVVSETRYTIADSDRKVLASQIERAGIYLEEQTEIARLYADPKTRGQAIDLMTKKVNQTVKDVRDTSWGDFADQMDNPTAKVSAAEERLAVIDKAPVEELAQQIENRILGTTILGDKSGKLIIRLFEDANFSTLVHENAHVFRNIIDGKDLAKLERAYGVSPGGKWGRAAEESFADDFTAYLASGKQPANTWLTPIFERTRSVLSDFWVEARRIFAGDNNGFTIPEGTRQLLDEYLDPAIFPTEALPGFEMRQLPTEPRHLVAEARRLPPEVPTDTSAKRYRTGVTTGRTAEQFRASFKKERALTAQRQKLIKQQAAMKKALLDDAGPISKRQKMLRQRAGENLESVSGSADDPSVARVPAQWQPLWKAVKEITEEAQTNPALAEAIGDMPDTFSAVIERAKEIGLDPVHVRNFTQKQVQSLVMRSMKLGRPNQRLGEEAVAGTRKARAYSDKSGYASIESLAAAVNEVTWEHRTNFVVNHIETNIARVTETGDLPENWVSWSATKQRLTELDVATGARRVQPGDLIVPKAVDDVLRRYNKDFTHPWATTLAKVTKPWRTFVLLLSPRWYVNNLLGNMMLATAEGVRIQDWVKAWRSWKNKAGAFDDIPEAVGHSFVAQELGQGAMGGGLVNYGTTLKGIRQATKKGGLKGGVNVATAKLARYNTVVDDMARAAVYHKTIRTTGSAERAVQRSYEALVDYGNLSSFEQQMVRAVVPFYSWQKGMLKAVGRIYIEHPAAIGAMFWLDRLNKQIMQDRYGTELPAAYEGLIEVPFLGTINTRGLNPFQDAAQLTTPEGIAQSINPLVKLALQGGFHAPQYGQGKRQVGAFGVVEDFVDYEAGLTGIITGLPQAQAIMPQGKNIGVVSSIEKYLGIPVIPPKQLEAIISRTIKARASVANAGKSKRKKKKKSVTTSSLITRLQKQLAGRAPKPF